MKVLVQGWIQYPHSYVIVNINQILALHRKNVDVFFEKVAPFKAEWSVVDLKNLCLFSEEDIDILQNITAKPIQNVNFDIVYRISYPYITTEFVNPDKTSPPVLVFYTAEFAQIHDKDIADASASDFVELCRLKKIIPITPSNWSALALRQYGVIPFVIPHGICTDKLYPDENGGTVTKNVCGIPENSFVILHVGAMTANKNISAILQSFYRLATTDESVYLVLKGLGSLYDSKKRIDSSIDDLVSRHVFSKKRWKCIRKRCIVIDQILSYDQMRDLYNMCDVYVSPYVAEGFNMPVLEALACGKPVIVSKGGSTDDFTNDKVALYPTTVPAHTLGQTRPDNMLFVDVNSLQDKLTQIIKDVVFRKNAFKESTKLVHSNYKWDTIAELLIEVMYLATHHISTLTPPLKCSTDISAYLSRTC